MPLCVGFKLDCWCQKTHFKRVLNDRWCRFLTGRQSHSGARVPGTTRKYDRLFRGTIYSDGLEVGFLQLSRLVN